MSNDNNNYKDELFLSCPNCQKGRLVIHKTIYEVKHGDKLLIIKLECDKCNYVKNDVIPAETSIKPGISILKVDNENDLKSKIFRSSSAKLEIPELELVIEPGPYAGFFFTNVEGVLDRFLRASKIIYNDVKNDITQNQEIEQAIEDIQKAMDGKLKFTIKITDPLGGSYIVPIDKSKYTFIPLNDLKKENNKK